MAAGLADPTNASMWDNCATCAGCANGRPAPLGANSNRSICSMTEDTSIPCGIACESGYYITYNIQNGGVICNECSVCAAGSTPARAGACSGKVAGKNTECTLVPQVMGQNQTSCQSFVGVWTDMVLDPGNVSTGDSVIFDSAGATTSTATHVLYEIQGWCIRAYRIQSKVPLAAQLIGVPDSVGAGWASQRCKRFVPLNQAQLTEAITRKAVMQAVDETFIFGDITSLVYDYPSDNLFFVATTYEVNGPPGSNSAGSLTNRRDEILAMKMNPCIESTSTGCLPRRVIDKSVWRAKYGGDGTKRLNEFGQIGKGIMDISIVHYDDPGSTYIVMAQVSMPVSTPSSTCSVVYDKRACACRLGILFSVLNFGCVFIIMAQVSMPMSMLFMISAHVHADWESFFLF